MNQHFFIGSTLIFTPKALDNSLEVMSHDTRIRSDVKPRKSLRINDLAGLRDSFSTSTLMLPKYGTYFIVCNIETDIICNLETDIQLGPSPL